MKNRKNNIKKLKEALEVYERAPQYMKKQHTQMILKHGLKRGENIRKLGKGY